MFKMRYLSRDYFEFLLEYMDAYPEVAFAISEDGPLYWVGLSYRLENGVVMQAQTQMTNPDMAFLVAYATLGMNFGIW